MRVQSRVCMRCMRSGPCARMRLLSYSLQNLPSPLPDAHIGRPDAHIDLCDWHATLR